MFYTAINHNETNFTIPHATGRTFLAFSILLFFVRIFQFYTISRRLGPKIIMVSKMVSRLNKEYFKQLFGTVYCILKKCKND